MSEFIIDEILPTHEIHTIAGPSGVGKTTWAFQALLDLLDGRPILGYKSTPTTFAYIGDRSKEGMKRTLARMDVKLPPELVYGFDELPGNTIEAIIKWSPHPLIIIESFMLLMPDSKNGNSMNSYQSTGKWLRSVLNCLKQHDKTIIAHAHSPKLKPTEVYTDKRQRALGSVAYAGLTETMFLLERHPETHNQRILNLLPRNAPEAEFYYFLDKCGRFVELAGAAPNGVEADLLKLLETYTTGELNTGDFVMSAVSSGICSEKSAYNFLSRMKKEGTLLPIGKGRVKILKPS